MVFSGTEAAGTPSQTSAERCNDWTTNANSGVGATWGYTHVTTSLWSAGCYSTDSSCDIQSPIYCFEQ